MLGCLPELPFASPADDARRIRRLPQRHGPRLMRGMRYSGNTGGFNSAWSSSLERIQ